MLEANARHMLLDALRPPPGFSLDRAVGTTYSLDLHALLTAPLAFALFDAEAEDEVRETPGPALLEAVRKHAERIDIFCQAGQIAFPGRYRAVVAYLEQSVHEVSPRTDKRVFHPKVWVLRYVNPEAGDRRFRLLCLTRNLTFDRSWDTVLQLDGAPTERAGETSEPLIRFLRTLSKLAVNAIPPVRRRDLEQIADELRHVRFSPPTGFRELRFWPLGLPRSPWPFDGLKDSRKLVISPFLSEKTVGKLTAAGDDILVSRAESLDAITPAVVTTFGSAFTLDGDAQGENDENGEPQTQHEEVAEAAGGTLRGLHAKLYLFETRTSAHLFTGSANATTAAFNGNIEFLVELVGDRNTCGIEAILDGTGGTSFRSLLEEYAPPAAAVGETADERLERQLDELRRSLAAGGFEASATRTAANEFTLALSTSTPADLSDSTRATCWPLSLPPARAQPLTKTWQGGATFKVSEEGLTSFFVVDLALSEGRRRKTVRFIINAKLIGAPEDRLDRLLVQLLQTRGDVLRYLLFLLADEGSSELQRLLGTTAMQPGDGTGDETQLELPLFESLVRALARSPERLDNVARLVASLIATAEGRERLPDDFDAVWNPIWQARSEASRQ